MESLSAWMLLPLVVGILLCSIHDAYAAAPEIDMRHLPTAAVVEHALKYGTTPEKRALKHEAKEELLARGPESIHYLMQHIHYKNLGIRVLTDYLVENLKGNSAPVLLEFLDAPHADTRKFAAYFLGYFFAPQYAERVRPLLKDDEAAGGAIRTLGKWGDTESIPAIAPFISSEDERRRVAAVNALRDIGHPSALPYLESASQDKVFTVQKAAERAIGALAGEEAGP